MKRILLIATFAVCTLISACTDDLKLEINLLKDDVAALENRVAKLNESLASLSDLITAVEQNDHIASITKYPEGSQYACSITFTSGASITLKNGKDGVSPIVGVRYNEQYGGYYWTIQMGPDGKPTWMTNSYGGYVRATGTVPKVKIEDGIWWYSYDGNSWNKCNWAAPQGEPGTSVFQRIDTSDPLYVIFILADGTVVKLPTQEAFETLSKQCDDLNNEFTTYSELIQNLDKDHFIQSVTQFEEGGDSGYRITLESGKQLTIRNGRNSTDSLLLTARVYTDGKYYWAWRSHSDESYQWLYYNGEMVCVTMEDVTPRIGITDSLGQLYFTVTVGGNTEMMKDRNGNPAVATGRVDFDLITDVDLSEPYTVILTLLDGTKVKLPLTRPKAPTLELSYGSEGVEGSKSYSYQLMVFYQDTLDVSCSNFAAYADAAGITMEAIAVDEDCTVEDPQATNFTCTAQKDGRYAYDIILVVPFTTGSSSSWDPSRPLRIAIFVTWGNNTIMKVASFNRIIHANAVYLSPTSLNLAVGASATVKASLTPYNTTDTVKWSTSDKKVATVSDKGVVKAVAAGTCNIIATAGTMTAICVCTVH